MARMLAARVPQRLPVTPDPQTSGRASSRTAPRTRTIPANVERGPALSGPSQSGQAVISTLSRGQQVTAQRGDGAEGMGTGSFLRRWTSAQTPARSAPEATAALTKAELCHAARQASGGKPEGAWCCEGRRARVARGAVPGPCPHAQPGRESAEDGHPGAIFPLARRSLGWLY